MILLILSAAALVWVLSRFPLQRMKILCISAFIFFPLLLVSGIASFMFKSCSDVASRYAGFSIVGLAWAFCEIGQRNFALRKWIVCPVIGIFMTMCFDNIQYWRSNKVFAVHILEMNPESFIAQHIMGSVEQSLHNLPQALAFYTRSTELNPNFFISSIMRARVLVDMGELEKAAVAYEKLTEDFPNMGQAYYEYGLLLNGQGRYDDAIKKLKKALEEGYQQAQTYHQLGMLHAKKNDFEQSSLNFEQALDLSPDNESFKNSYNRSLELLKAAKGSK